MADLDWLKKRGVTDERVLAALENVNREHFADPDNGIETLPAADVVGRMLQALRLNQDSNVLQVGTGSGYTAALLSSLSTSVYTVERDSVLARYAAKRLATNGFKNVQVLTGKTLRQYAANAPYDGILVSASMAKLPQRLAKRLGVQGALVAPVGPHGKQKLVRLTRLTEHNFQEESLGDLRVKPMLGDILVEMGVVDRAEVEMAALEADVKGTRLGEALLEGHYVDESDIYKALARQNGLKLYDAEALLRHLDRDIVAEFPRPFLLHNRLIPVARREDTLYFATSDPNTNVKELAQSLGVQNLSLGMITPTDYQMVWMGLEPPPEAKPIVVAPRPTTELGAGPSMVEDAGRFDAETIALFQRVVIEAVQHRASDVHFERYEQDVRIRYRVDGELREPNETDVSLTPELLAGVVQLVKVSARMEPSERRLPQTGHFQRRVDGRVFDIRARTQPTMYGETVVLRLLPQDAKILTIEELGFTSQSADLFRDALEAPSGIVLVVGPTGSGKSTTLYAAIQAIAEDTRRKVVSVEHPVTYALPFVHQVRISRSQRFGVPQAIASVMSDDADVLLVGDLGDRETAEWAVKASQAGHLVLATTHGRDVIDGIRSLSQFGLDPNTIATELSAVVAQRLVKRVCPNCRERVDTDYDLIGRVFEGAMPDDFTAFEGVGCESCEDRGTRGRVAVTEVLDIDPVMRAAITDRPSVEALRAAALESGMTTLLDTAVRFVSNGVIPQGELRWVPSWN